MEVRHRELSGTPCPDGARPVDNPVRSRRREKDKGRARRRRIDLPDRRDLPAMEMPGGNSGER